MPGESRLLNREPLRVNRMPRTMASPRGGAENWKLENRNSWRKEPAGSQRYKRKSPGQKPGRSFLQKEVYQTHNPLVKTKISMEARRAGTPINQIPGGVSTLLLPPRPPITLTQY